MAINNRKLVPKIADIIHLSSKRNDGWCDNENVKSWSGYLDIIDSDSHLFFYYFESRSKPTEDPVVLWLNG